MSEAKLITVPLIRDWEPCYDPAKKVSEDWQGTIFDVLGLKDVSFEDKLWLIMRTDLVSEKLMRLFAVWCARQVQHLMHDQRSIDALDVAERFAHKDASKEELDAAWYTARYTAWDAAWDAATAAARATATAAARAAATAAAWAAAWAAAGAAARDAQEKKLREMIAAGIETGDVVLEPQPSEGVE